MRSPWLYPEPGLNPRSTNVRPVSPTPAAKRGPRIGLEHMIPAAPFAAAAAALMIASTVPSTSTYMLPIVETVRTEWKSITSYRLANGQSVSEFAFNAVDGMLALPEQFADGVRTVGYEAASYQLANGETVGGVVEESVDGLRSFPGRAAEELHTAGAKVGSYRLANGKLLADYVEDSVHAPLNAALRARDYATEVEAFAQERAGAFAASYVAQLKTLSPFPPERAPASLNVPLLQSEPLNDVTAEFTEMQAENAAMPSAEVSPEPAAPISSSEAHKMGAVKEPWHVLGSLTIISGASVFASTQVVRDLSNANRVLLRPKSRKDTTSVVPTSLAVPPPPPPATPRVAAASADGSPPWLGILAAMTPMADAEDTMNTQLDHTSEVQPRYDTNGETIQEAIRRKKTVVRKRAAASAASAAEERAKAAKKKVTARRKVAAIKEAELAASAQVAAEERKRAERKKASVRLKAAASAAGWSLSTTDAQVEITHVPDSVAKQSVEAKGPAANEKRAAVAEADNELYADALQVLDGGMPVPAAPESTGKSAAKGRAKAKATGASTAKARGTRQGKTGSKKKDKTKRKSSKFDKARARNQ